MFDTQPNQFYVSNYKEGSYILELDKDCKSKNPIK